MRAILVLGMALAVGTVCIAQNYDYGARGPVLGSDRTNLANVAGVGGGLDIKLVDESQNARDKRVVVRANVTGVELVQPNSQGEMAQYRGFLQYRLDGSAPVETTRLQHEFGNLSSGEHTVEVALVTGNRAKITEPKKMIVKIP